MKTLRLKLTKQFDKNYLCKYKEELETLDRLDEEAYVYYCADSNKSFGVEEYINTLNKGIELAKEGYGKVIVSEIKKINY